jgi:hypothetical protein
MELGINYGGVFIISHTTKGITYCLLMLFGDGVSWFFVLYLSIKDCMFITFITKKLRRMLHCKI